MTKFGRAALNATMPLCKKYHFGLLMATGKKEEACHDTDSSGAQLSIVERLERRGIYVYS
jgi:hypothetical protein